MIDFFPIYLFLNVVFYYHKLGSALEYFNSFKNFRNILFIYLLLLLLLLFLMDPKC